MSIKGKIFESLNDAFPLKPIQDDRHLEAALQARDKVNRYLEKKPAHRDEITGYLHDLEELIQEFKNKHDVH